jgi:hypothetical protein
MAEVLSSAAAARRRAIEFAALRAAPLFSCFFVEECSVPPLRGGGDSLLILDSRLAGAGAFFSRERKEAKDRLRNYVP